MHEWSLAEGIIQTSLEVARNNNASRIVSMTIALGELQDVERELVEFALSELKRGTIAEGAEIKFMEEEALFRCRDCGHEWRLKEVGDKFDRMAREDVHFIPEVVHAFLECPICGSRDFEVVHGRGTYIREIEIEE